jgi:hypothetical protein
MECRFSDITAIIAVNSMMMKLNLNYSGWDGKSRTEASGQQDTSMMNIQDGNSNTTAEGGLCVTGSGFSAS